MIDQDKREFLAVIERTADLYDKKIPKERVSVYWDALAHRSLDDIRLAINSHIQDKDRGRFFPLPADIAAQLPNEASAWLTADEAWASCPKDESDSAAMCDEIASALYLAKDLIEFGDMVAARRAFIDNYSRLVDEAKREGRNPVWWASLGHNPETRHKAQSQIVERQNLALPPAERKALPASEEAICCRPSCRCDLRQLLRQTP